ncbi:MAG: hypothetical protein CME26_09035 [Gemmatimonadetes bacterium]|nr:hypothetical protein [Gemmatimonadota bacterium]
MIDWEKEGAEAAARLGAMLRFDTTNPPGNELPLVEWLAESVRGEGLDAEVIESAASRGNLAVRMKGSGKERPLLFLSHLDVVPAEPARWTHPPFEGTIADGHVWGRGAIDSKLTGATQLQALLMAHRAGLALERDLVLVAAADEELGGVHGVRWLAQHRPDLFDAEYGINEAGGFAVEIGGHPVYLCQVGEKGSAPIDLVGRGRPGHSSVPHNDNPIVDLGVALSRMEGTKLSHQPPASVRAFFEEAAKIHPDEQTAAHLQACLDPKRADEAIEALDAPQATRLMLDAMLRNTCAPTMLSAGLKRNVIPSDARAALSGRPLPGVTEEEFISEVRALVGDAVEIELTGEFHPGVEFDHETPLYDFIAASTRKYEPDAIVVPYMQTGGTDARFLKHLDIAIHGYIPMRYEAGMDFFELCHGHDERVSTTNVTFAVQILYDLVLRLNGLLE